MKNQKMFSFITKTWNPIAGGYVDSKGVRAACSYLCKYCWARDLINRHKWDKYLGEFRIHDPAMKVKFTPDDFVFVCDMTDIGNPNIPKQVTIDLFGHIAVMHKETKFLLLTKNPYFYIAWHKPLPENVYLGATIETDLDHTDAVSFAPSTTLRLAWMDALMRGVPDHPRFVSVEPIMKFSEEFADRLIALEPWAVAVGYDNYDNGLTEPTLEETESFIQDLEEEGITVYRKTIKRARQ